MRAVADRSRTRSGSPLVRRLIIGGAVTWLLAALALPVASVFVTAFSAGWSAFADALTRSDVLHAAKLTAIAVVASIGFTAVFGLAAAWTVTRTKAPGRKLVPVLLDVPVAISPVIAGLMILLLYGRRGWFGGILDNAGITFVFALPAIVLATIFVTLPFVAKEVMAVLEEEGEDGEHAAATLGASRTQTVLYVVLPNLKWAAFYGIVLTAARAVGEFGAVSVVSGNLIGETQTLPLFIEHAYSNYETVAAFAAAVPLTVAAAFTLLARATVAALEKRRASIALDTSEGGGR
ncbi:MAG: sulfate ABC transporter permease [Coriobacteriales bacterium]|nr:sulfate ABC transporter permease [Coriobacteriales bacterium]